MKLAFTVDFEDWYQGVDIPISTWGNYEKRLQIGHYKLLNLLQKNKIKATYYLLGKTIEEHPNLIKEIIAEGHQIGCHTYSHPFLYKITPAEFEEELVKCESLINSFNINYAGFRAPYFSIDNRNLWALDIIKKMNYVYNSSIFAGDAKRTGIPNFKPNIQQHNNGLIEFPIATFKIFNVDFAPGGGYFRLLPYSIFKTKLKKMLSQNDTIFYIHPWELDSKHPKISGLNKRIAFTHYVNLHSTENKLNKLFKDFETTSVENILKLKTKN